MRRLFALIVFCLGMGICMAAPVRNMSVIRIQPKGDTLHCFVTGDEFFHRLHDAEGYTIVLNPATGEYVYAAIEDGKLVPTQYLPGRINPAMVGLEPGLMPSKEELVKLHKVWDVQKQHHQQLLKKDHLQPYPNLQDLQVHQRLRYVNLQ